jgi:serine/threonine protein kinase
MELCGGGSLLTIYEDFPKDDVPCNEPQIAFIMKESLKVNKIEVSLKLGRGLSTFTHLELFTGNSTKPLVFLTLRRDLKAANILITDRGEIKLGKLVITNEAQC